MKKRTITALAITGLMTAGWAQEEATTAQGADVRNTDPAITEGVETENGTKIETDSEQKADYIAYSGVIDSSELVSAEVYNRREETIGSIDRLLVNSESGQVEHAVVSVGGFLGIGDRLVAVPWSSFDIKQEAKMTDSTASSAEEIDAETTDSEQLAANTEADAEEAEDAAEEAEDSAEEAEEAEEETYENQAEAERSALELHIYLDADEERLENAPEFDPDTPNQLGNSSSTDYWNKEWSPQDSEKRNEVPETTDADSDAESTKVSSL